MFAYQTASSSLYLDSVTVAPPDTAAGRGVALGILAGASHSLFANEAVGKLLAELGSQLDTLDRPVRRQVEELTRSYGRCPPSRRRNTPNTRC